jgi:hypothetical protein
MLETWASQLGNAFPSVKNELDMLLNRQRSFLSDRSMFKMPQETKYIIIKIEKGDILQKWGQKSCVSENKSELSSHPQWARVACLQEEGKEVEGRNKLCSIFFLTNDVLFFSPFVLLPESPSLSHIHFPLLMTRVGKLLQTNPAPESPDVVLSVAKGLC